MTVDVGLLWYLYPDTTGTDYAEPYASVSGAFGPLEAKVGVAYAPDQDAIGSDDNLYVFTDVSAAIPETPLTLKAHYGYTDGSLGGLNGSYSDWSRSEEHTSELQSLMRISYAVFCLKKKNNTTTTLHTTVTLHINVD